MSATAQLLNDLAKLERSGWTIEQVRRLHHWHGTPAERRVTFASLCRYFEKGMPMKKNNADFAAKVRSQAQRLK